MTIPRIKYTINIVEVEEESEDPSLKKFTSSSVSYPFPTTINMYTLLLLIYDFTVSTSRLNFDCAFHEIVSLKS